ncbi:MAG: MFS transporter [Alphaproteobacteria bacterium]|nr:MFS transporter [Alphaproteobacteria bacterium]
MPILSTSDARQMFSAYHDRRMLRILLLGVMSGFPWVLIGSALTLWLKEDGLSRSAVGWAGLIFSIYAVNFLWAPVIDRLTIPYLGERIGQRKAWIICFQAVILVALIGWSLLRPADNIWLVMAIGLAIAAASASQDITIDALRIEQIDASETTAMAAGASVHVVGWWSGYKIGGIVALVSADWLQNAGFANYWQLSFIGLGLIVLATNIGLLFIPEASPYARQQAQKDAQSQLAAKFGATSPVGQLAGFLGSTVWTPLVSFFQKNGIAVGAGILAFVLLFKIGEAFMGKMSLVFYAELGFSKSDIALYSKGVGWITTVAFTLLGGMLAIRSGAVRALFVAGIAMAATNLLFTLLAWTGKSEWLFALAVLLDDIAAAFATVAFVTFISLLVDRTYTATQYALLASIGTIGRTSLAASSGAMVDWLDGDWGLFFVITALMVLPSLALLWGLRHRIRLVGTTAPDKA